jgi:hypothetical protein
MKRSGIADLPLHGGRVPPWLANRMTELGTAIAEQVILNYGPSEFLTRLSDPFWFQAYGAVMGMDWHSSGITTSVLGALKRGMNPRFSELGLMVCGGRGRHSIRTPDELRAFSEKTGLDGDMLARTSRLTARIDNNAVADGFQLYLHSFGNNSVGGMGRRATGDESQQPLGAPISLAFDHSARFRVCAAYRYRGSATRRDTQPGGRAREEGSECLAHDGEAAGHECLK